MVMWNHRNAASPEYRVHYSGLPGLQFEDQKLWCMPMLTWTWLPPDEVLPKSAAEA